ncbi:MAG: 50S ribosomal protein L13 [Candidatus Aenigmarchaeota archaeon]|nr:50S ribosomal protein L13 [Candidatus Aenigmarchaeota archaeon]
MEVIDAQDSILGRLATEVAKKSLKGEEFIILNAEKIVISGNKEVIFKRYLERRQRGCPIHGPFFPSKSDMIVKRAIRTMLPYKKAYGKQALKRIKVFSGVPEEYKDKKMVKIGKQADKLNCNFVFIYEVSEYLGGIK